MNGKGIIWVLIGMHNESSSSVGFLDCTDVVIVVHFKNCKWIERLDVLKGVHSLHVKEPEVPEEGSHKDLVVETLLEDA